MKISKAMKKISRLKGEICKIDIRIHQCISTNDVNEFIEDYNKLMTTREEKVKELMKLKNAVMVQNIKHGKFETIIHLSELKNKIDLYKGLNIKIGITNDGYSSEPQTYKSQITVTEKNELIDELQRRIEALTDELDEFNATTSIDL